MKRSIFTVITLLSVVLFSCGAPENSTSKQGNGSEQTAKAGAYSNVSVADLRAANESAEDVIILDVRTPGELSDGYVENAINIDVNNSNFKSKASELDKSKTVYVYCRSGHRSQSASKALVKMGFTDVRNVEGGFLEWADKGYKLVK